MSEGEVIRALARLIDGRVANAFTGKVDSVDEDKGVAKVKHNDFTYTVKLRSVISGSARLLTIPTVGSKIFCVSEGNSEERYVAVAYNEISKIDYQGENISFSIDDAANKVNLNANEIAFNGGELGGLVLAKELKTQLDKQSARIDGIINAIKAGVPIPQDGGVGLQTTIKTALESIVNKEDFSSIENRKITQ